ncbi:MAG TPA: hypothetical protein VNF05_10440 [Acidimicrobiales bacterium]|nr:hypothetical protein [Acidimicrobiales bacterium]
MSALAAPLVTRPHGERTSVVATFYSPERENLMTSYRDPRNDGKGGE